MVFTLGVMVIELNGEPVLQVYESAAEAESVADLPAHTALGPDMDNIGLNTFICMVLVPVQPFALPKTVYTLVVLGVSLICAVVAPVFHE